MEVGSSEKGCRSFSVRDDGGQDVSPASGAESWPAHRAYLGALCKRLWKNKKRCGNWIRGPQMGWAFQAERPA